MASLTQLLASLDDEAHRKGSQFERLVQWWLQNSPVFAHQAPAIKQVWLWDDWPGRWGPDCGIDLIAELTDGQLWAVQAKHYAEQYAITKQDVDSFLSESSRPQISRRLLVATTDQLAPNAARVIASAEKPVDLFLLSTLEADPVQWPASLTKLTGGKPKRKTPLPHQRAALKAIKAGFKTDTRGQAIMACGTGKTLVALWAAERLGSKRTLVLVPSLALMSQTIREWSANGKAFQFLPVCSESTVAEGSDPLVESAFESGMPTATTDPARIVEFLRGKTGGPKVVFCTYQSSLQIQAAQQAGAPSFDLVIADEAHQCTGVAGSAFTAVLDEKLIKAKRRLFMTATPRVYTRKARQEMEVISMDDESRFGREFFRLDFADAINPKVGEPLLCDYQLVVSAVSSKEVQQAAEDAVFLKLIGGSLEGRKMDARTLGAHITLAKAARKYQLGRVITFHSRVKGAERFSLDFPLVAGWLPARTRPKGDLWCRYVSGEMPGRKREALLGAFRALSGSQLGVLSNARCLAEGVDVPAIDAVAFIDPRGSEVDIIQAVGRAIRKSPGKKLGTIVVPVFLGEHDDAGEALEAGAFNHVWRVLRALRAHDESLGVELDGARRKLGARKARPQTPPRIVIDLPQSAVDASFHKSFSLQLVDATTASWEEHYGRLQAYVEEHGDAMVPQVFVTSDGFRLGGWVRSQRFRCSDPERRRKLEMVPGWVWDTLSEAFEDGLVHLKNYQAEHGSARVPNTFVTADGFQLGTWVSNQRIDCSEVERRQRLESVDGWSWKPQDDSFQEGLAYLHSYVNEKGGGLVPTGFVTDDGFRLGQWVRVQRRSCSNPERRAQLESTTGWSWDPFADSFEQGFRQLKDFASENGNAMVPSGFITADGFRLGQWVGVQRQKCDNPERRARLEALPGWSWNATEDAFEQGFGYLQAYVDEHGDALVRRGFVTADGFKLDQWVKSQRRKCPDDSRRQRLEALPGWSWAVHASSFERGFDLLVLYSIEHGDTRVPQRFVTADGFRLGSWVNGQRTKCDNPERRARLEALPGWSWNPQEAKFENGLQHLQAYVAETGDAAPPKTFKTVDGFPLGSWVNTQRQDCIIPERRARLEALPGWSWNPMADKFETGFQHLQAYAAEAGDAAPPKTFKTVDGYKLGSWVSVQRSKCDDPERRARLEVLPGWYWAAKNK